VDDSRVSPVRCRAPGWDRVLKSPVNLTSTGCDTGGLGPSRVRVTNPIELYVLSRLTITRVLIQDILSVRPRTRLSALPFSIHALLMMLPMGFDPRNPYKKLGLAGNHNWSFIVPNYRRVQRVQYITKHKFRYDRHYPPPSPNSNKTWYMRWGCEPLQQLILQHTTNRKSPVIPGATAGRIDPGNRS